MVDSPASTSSQHGAQHQRIMSTGTPSAGALSPTGPSSEGQFNIDAFDFSAEFALPTGLDELNIFAGATSVAEAHQQGSSSGASGSVGAPSPAAGSANNAGGGGGSAGFSPAGSMRGERSSRHGSPRAQMGSLNGSTTPGANGMSAGASSPLAQLLMNMGENGNVQAALGILRSNQQQQQQQQQHHDATGQRQMSINDLQRILVEKEQAERLQNMQTAVLRQQLEALQRQTGAQVHQHQQQQAQQQHHNQQQQAHHHHHQQQHHQQHHQEDQQMLSSHHLAHLEQQQQQQQMGGSGTPTQQHPGPSNGYPYPASQPYSQPHEAPHGLHLQMPSSYSQQQQQQQPLQSPGIPSPCDPTSSAMAQYGLMTPMNSGAFNSNAQASVQAFANNTFSPLESPAITPASVFSNAPTATSSADFFSPLTSPALRPQPPSAGEMMLPPAQSPRGVRSSSGGASGANGSASGSGTKRGGGVAAGAVSPAFGPQYHSTTPTASPLALMGHAKPGPLPRKNRSTTAEARANKMRPSPLVKPTAPPSRGRTRGNSIAAAAAAAAAASATATPTTALAGSAPGSRRPSVSEGSASGGVSRSNSQQRTPSYSVSAFTPLAGTSKSLDASPSEGAASTPSPIDLSASSMPPPAAPATGKPLTPGSIMGIGASSKKANGTTAASKGKTKATSNGSASVTFADSPTNGVVEHPRFEPDWITASATHMKQSGGGPDSRRTSHKAAEQKRRDSLKYCFDELRGMLPAITLDDAAPGGSYLGPDGRLEDIEAEQFNPAEVCDAETARLANRAISKVALLRHSNEYLIRISNRLARRDAALAEARAEIVQLRGALGLPTPQPMMHHHQNHHLINDHHMMAMHDDSGGQMDVS